MELNLTWLEFNQVRTFVVYGDRHRERAVQVGRDPLRSELVIPDPTVSGLHIAIYYEPVRGKFLVQSLRASNPVLVDGKKVLSGEVALGDTAQIQMGAVVISTEVRKAEVLSQDQQYGLKCPKCLKVSAYDRLKLVCPWCGTSLAAAPSVIIM